MKTGQEAGRRRWRRLAVAAFVAAAAWLGTRAQASEFEIVATSFTVDNQVNVGSVTYFNGQATTPANPAAATLYATPGGLYFDANQKVYKVWDANALAWIQVATGTLAGSQVSGSGTTNFAARWTAAGTLGSSTLQDNGTSVSLGQAPTLDLLSTGGTGTVNFGNTGGVTILGLTVSKSAGITTLYEGTGTTIPIAKIK